MKRFFFIVFSGLLFFTALIPSAQALEKPGEELQDVGITERRGEQVDLSLLFTNEQGEQRTLRELLPTDKPTILVPVYYSCPRLCGFVLSGVVDLLNKVELKLGVDFNVLAVSFDAEEGAPLAAKRASEYRARLTTAGGDAWRFAVGSSESITRLMDEVGFRFKRDGNEFAHSAVIIVLTPEGKISQYFTGIEYAPWDVRLALVDASQGAVGSAIDHVLLFCFRFDPTKGKYTLAAFNLLKVAATLSLLGLGSLIFFSTRKKA